VATPRLTLARGMYASCPSRILNSLQCGTLTPKLSPPQGGSTPWMGPGRLFTVDRRVHTANPVISEHTLNHRSVTDRLFCYSRDTIFRRVGPGF
jgi:hypothetical protein